jgi:hypothetical protein
MISLTKEKIKAQIELDRTMTIYMHFLWLVMLIANLIFNNYISLTLFILFLGLAIYFNMDMRYWQLLNIYY